MKTVVRKMGNSRGVIIPKPLLDQIGLVDAADMTIEKDALVLRPLRHTPRAGWAAAARTLNDEADDTLAWPEFANDDDSALQW